MDRHSDMISVNNRTICSLASGPGFSSHNRANTWASRSGRYAIPFLICPISRARPARVAHQFEQLAVNRIYLVAQLFELIAHRGMPRLNILVIIQPVSAGNAPLIRL